MPELPEVRTVVKYLEMDLKNQKILKAKFLVPKMVQKQTATELSQALSNKVIKQVGNYGKFILFYLDQDQVLISHLRMEGKYRFSPQLTLKKHDHAYFKFKQGYLIYQDVRKFGTFELKSVDELMHTPPLNKLGPLPQVLSATKLYSQLQRKRIAIKSALLDQTLVLGLGNIYVDEVLFAAQVHPQRAAHSLSLKEVKKIIQQAQRIIAHATAEGGSSIRTYLAYGTKQGNYQNFLKVHTKVNKPCPVCQNPIQKLKVNGRGTYFCPICQK